MRGEPRKKEKVALELAEGILRDVKDSYLEVHDAVKSLNRCTSNCDCSERWLKCKRSTWQN
jgi:hypothetical protein